MGLFFKRTPKAKRAVSDNSFEKPAVTFRRNRTLANTSAADQIGMETSDRTQTRKLSQRRRKLGLILMVIIILTVILLWLISHLTVKTVILVDNASTMSRLLETERYDKAIQDYLRLRPLARFRFVFDQADFDHYISEQLPEVKQVTQLGRGQIGETKFQVSMRVPVAVWRITKQQYYVDGSGAAFELNYFREPTVTIVDSSEIALGSNKTVTSSRFLRFVGRVVALSEERGFTVAEAIIPVGTTRQLEIKIEGRPSIIRLSIDRGAGEQVEDMARSLVYLANQGQSPEYIDVRVSNKAFYN